MNNYRLDTHRLWIILEGWEHYLHKKVHLIACGGTALTIQGIKPSTKDVDFMVPVDTEYVALVRTLSILGYSKCTGSGWSRGDGIVFDLFQGNCVYITELLESPLKKNNNVPIKDLKKIYVGALNDYDLIITKLFRASPVDIEDCLALMHCRGDKFDLEKLKNRYRETASYDVNPERLQQNLKSFLNHLKKR